MKVATDAPEPCYPGVKYHPPIHFNGSTIYVNEAKQLSRVKLRRGDRLDKPFSFKREPEEVWRRVLNYCRTGTL